ncbi:MAG: T9SS type A sorting domain-containing protein [bacterium]|nr:T9SS type A sorting domain-containing protein [bacterium]
MKLRMICMALALMALASVSFGQFNAVLYTTDTFTTGCDGGDMLPDGSPVVSVYWDANNNGPDAADVIAPDAVQSVYALNGNDYLGIPGAFYTDPAFTYNAFTPAVSKFYVVVNAPSARYTSRVLTIPNAYSEHDLTGSWTCQVTVVPCDEPTEINIETVGGRDFLPDGATYTNCFGACAGTTVTICLGPLAPDEMPIAGFGECQGTPASFSFGQWQYVGNAISGMWCLQLVIETEGCICFRLDDILAAELGSFDAVARDNSVELRWNTISESNVESFSVLRKIAGHESFDLIGNVAAANSATGATYSFVDNGAVNGTSYEYTLETVNLSGSRESWGVIASATPSVDAAVVTEYALHQNYPNPFNPSTNLVFDVVAENVVNLTVYNAMGQEVASLVNGTMAAGRHTVSFDAANLTSGLYFYTVKIGNEFTATKKMLLVK